MNQEEIDSLLAIRDKIVDKAKSTPGFVSDQAYSGLTNLGKRMVECSPKNTPMPSIKNVMKVLPKDSAIKQSIASSRFNSNEQTLYKYISKKHSADFIEHNLLYCDTIANCREGTWGDPKETVFDDMSDIINANDDEAYSLLNEILNSEGQPSYNQEQVFKQLLDAIGNKRICCVSSSPFIKEVWEWKGQYDALCVPINVQGLDFYRIEYSDDRINPYPYLLRFFNLLSDAFNGKASRRTVQPLFDELSALTYLSLCKKKTKREDGVRWDVQQEYRMFPEQLCSFNGNENCYINLKGRIGKPITYEDCLKHSNR